MELTNSQRPAIDSQLPLEKESQGPQALQLIITRAEELHNCPFWVSLYREGPVSPRHLFEIPSIEGIFKVLYDQGLKDKQPLMLAESSPGHVARQFYLIPEKICLQEPDRARDLIVSTLEALGPEKVGLYLPYAAHENFVSTHVIEEVSLGISFLRTKELHFYTGSLGINPLLNAALRIKSRLDGRREVLVYH